MTNDIALAPSIPKALAMLGAMENELTSAKTYDQIDDVIRRAKALKELFKGVEEVEHRAQIAIVIGKRRIGEELKKIPKATGGNPNLPRVGDSKAGTGIKHSERSRLGKLAAVPEQTVRATSTRLQESGHAATVNAVLKEITYGDKQAYRATRVAKVVAKAMPTGKFNVHVMDPPWQTETWSDRGKDRSADNHYATMAINEIQALPVASMMADDVFFGLWVTVPFMAQAIGLLPGWGLTYKSMLTWDKEITGTGKWLLNQTEHLIIATRGNMPAPAPGDLISSLYRERRGPHSAKPEAILDWVDKLYPAPVPKIEFFRRGAARPGWAAWGNEVLT